MGVEQALEPSIRETLVEVANERAATAQASTPAPEASSAPTPEAPPVETKAADAAPESQSEETRARDGKGRFAPKTAGVKSEGKPLEAATAAVSGQIPPQAATVIDEKPPEAGPEPLKTPQGLRAAAREEWAKTPRAVQEEFHRIDQEVRQALGQAAEHRKTAQAFKELVAPFEPLIRARGGEVLPVIQQTMQLRASLDYGSGRDRARLLAGLVRGYDIDVNELADEITRAFGNAGPAPQAQATFRDPRVDQLIAQLKDAERQTHEAAQTSFRDEVTGFAEKHEFFDDVAQDMAAIMRAKPKLSLEAAYEWALSSPEHKGLRQIVEQREAKKKAAGQNGAASARAASVSIRSQPATPMNGSTPGHSIIEDLRAAQAQLNGG